MQTIESIEKELKDKSLQSIYFLYGEEQFLLDTILKKIKTKFGECIKGINYINIDETNYMNIIQDIETPAFGYDKKLIIARNTGLLKKDGRKKNVDLQKVRDSLCSYMEKNKDIINDSIVLIFIEEDADTKLELYKSIDKMGVICNFEYQKPAQIQKRIKAICKAYNVQIDDNTSKYFIECCGTNMQELINEIRKLIEYAGQGGAIKKDDIDKLSIKKLESVIFDLTDNLGKKQVDKALEVLRNLINEKEPLQKILIYLYGQFKKLYLTKIALKYQKDIIQCLKLKPNQTFLVNKYKMQAGYFKENELKNIVKALIDLDYNYKNGLIDLQIGLESILCRYCS